ncbi:uncharacterized protein LOC131625373 [Vicia villosa]|uniref:uncharacterized protein LOC131625373 n=1 Tax=Vicia villosa TaxID=3911 RepID=UPI00273BD756|nr:uncharacterized protein LOC131625373 [Vicia villosa]
MSVDKLPFKFFDSINLKLFACNQRVNLLPNLWCLCSDNLSPQILEISDQHVAFFVTLNSTTFAMSAVYASNCHISRRTLWHKISNNLSGSVLPWCIVGDFNAIQGAHEHAGRYNPNKLHMLEFSNFIDNNNLVDIPTKGNFFSWTNSRAGSELIERRLDRALCNPIWLSNTTNLQVSTLNRLRSDHFPILLNFCFFKSQHFSSFRFLGMWTKHDNCEEFIAKCWSVKIVGCPMLACIQSELIGNEGNRDLKAKEVEAQQDLEKFLTMEEEFWKDKARIKWHLEGDRNTSFFHKSAKIKLAKNTITHLKTSEGMIHDPDAMAAHAVDYFSNLFCFAGTSTQDLSMVDECIPNLVDSNMNNFLISIPSADEVKKVVFNLSKDSAPGPDGFGGVFYHTYWSIIKHEVIAAVTQFFTTGWILPKYNSNNIILLPKFKDADTMESFRPIALANFKFKIITKI